MTSTPSGQLELVPLPPERWGKRFRRARTEHARLSLEEAAEAISTRWPISHTTLGRIEASEDAPRSRKHRIAAVYALVLYGVDPTDFGLSLDELPQPAPPKWTRAKGALLSTAA